MAKFKCKLSGNICNFEYEWDIAEMRKHPQYDEVKEEENELQTKVKKASKKEVITEEV